MQIKCNENKHIKGIKSGIRIASTTTFQIDAPTIGNESTNECDTNADTCCLGNNFILLNFTNRTAEVFPYNESYKPMTNVPIVTGATAYDDESSGETIILIVNEALYYGNKLSHSLLNPNQIRHYGLDVQDNPYDTKYDMGITIDDTYFVRFTTNGTKVQFKSRVPTPIEMENCQHFDITSPSEWNPHSIQLGKLRRHITSASIPTNRGNQNRQTHQITTMDTTNMSLIISKCTSVMKQYGYIGMDNNGDDMILHNMNPMHIELKERIIANVNVRSDDADVPRRRTLVSTERHLGIDPATIAELWGIGYNKAKATIEATMQRGIRSALLPLSRRYKADRMYKMKTLDAKFATDTLYAEEKSLLQNTCAQIYSNKVGFGVCYPMRNAKGATIGQTLKDFCHDFGIPAHLTFDGATAQVGKNTDFARAINKYEIKTHVSGPRRPNENPAESAIREIKKRWYRVMIKKQVPKRLWDFGLVWICETANLTVSSSHYANGRTALEYITGDTPDISEYIDFGFYDWVTYRTDAGLGPLSLGKWLGVSHKVGQLMSYWILPVSGTVISCTTVQRLTNAEMTTDEWKQQMNEYDNLIKERLLIQDINTNHDANDLRRWNSLSIDDNDPEFIEEWNRTIDNPVVPHQEEEDDNNNNDNIQPINIENNSEELFDPYVHMEIGLPRGTDNALEHATVKRRAIDVDGKPMGVAHKNPLLDTRIYEVEFIDGTIEKLSANIIAENLLSQVDEHGHRQMMLDEIIDHRKNDTAISKENGYIINGNTKRKKMTTRGWEICVTWKDGSTDWIALKDIKDSYPVELAEYAINNKIDDEPAFAWWVPYTIKKRISIIAKIKSKYWQRTHKYGIRIPKSVNEALQIDKEEGNNLWRDSIAEEMKKIKQAFRKYDGDPTSLIGYKEITTHIIFDIKMGENFRRKSRLVADGHKTDTPASVTYSTVVSRDSVRICLLIAALNDLDILSGDIENAYLTAPCREKVWTRGGLEFGNDYGNIFIIERALYGLKSSGAAFRAYLAERLDEIGFKSSIADPDVWLRPACKPDGERYYEYILVYVDDILCISTNPRKPMEEIQQKFKFKKDKIEPPEIYLGATIEKKKLNGKVVWTMSSRDYVKAIVNNVEERLKKQKRMLKSKVTTPMTESYKPEMDESDELDAEGVTMFQELIGMLRWAIELGRVDIDVEVSLLSQYQASPREGHLQQLLQIFSFLKRKPRLTLYFDDEEPIIDEEKFDTHSTQQEFQEIYRGAKEELPHNMPKPLGRSVKITAFVDASHAANKKTRRSHTGFVLFINRAPIIWYSKRQNTVESSTFSSEFIAMKVCMEHIVALRFKLRMFGIPIDGPAKVLSDNMSMVNNCSRLESTLNKKHSSIAYHAVRMAAAAGVIKTAWIDTNENIADAFTKRLSQEKREKLFGDWTY